jgi:Family of unknown function (DUF5670)
VLTGSITIIYGWRGLDLDALAYFLQIHKAGKLICISLLHRTRGENFMLWTLIVILLVLWALGFLGGVGGAAVGSLIHLLLVVALVVLILQLVRGRRV